LSPSSQTYQEEFRRRLRELGYFDGQTAIIDYRFTDGNDEGLPAAAKELATIPVDVIVCTNSAATAAAISATSTIPIVMVAVADPVASKFVTSLARPGGDVTGFGMLAPETGLKQLQFLKEAVPAIVKVVVFRNSLNPGNVVMMNDIQAVAKSLAIDLQAVEIRLPQNLNPAFEITAGLNPDGLLVLADQTTIRYRDDLVEFARKIRRPAVYGLREFVVAGGLMSYGVSFSNLHYRAADYVDQIIKGTKPVDLPVQLPTKFELVINLKTMKTLGIELPVTVSVLADEVIQ
jgi:putative tryptophan/tyrosine transport system substrate-binding protein